MLLGKEALGVQRNAEDQLRRLQAFTHSAPVLIAEPFQHTLLHIRDGKVGGNHYCNQCRGEDERLAQKACMNLVCRWHGMTWQCGPYSPHLLRFPIQLLPTNNMCRQDPHEHPCRGACQNFLNFYFGFPKYNLKKRKSPSTGAGVVLVGWHTNIIWQHFIVLL